MVAADFPSWSNVYKFVAGWEADGMPATVVCVAAGLAG